MDEYKQNIQEYHMYYRYKKKNIKKKKDKKEVISTRTVYHPNIIVQL